MIIKKKTIDNQNENQSNKNLNDKNEIINNNPPKKKNTKQKFIIPEEINNIQQFENLYNSVARPVNLNNNNNDDEDDISSNKKIIKQKYNGPLHLNDHLVLITEIETFHSFDKFMKNKFKYYITDKNLMAKIII